MQLNEIFAPNAVLTGLKAKSKSQVLRALAEAVARERGLEQQTVFDALHERERLGSTAIGDGVAIPHARLPGLDRPIGWIACLETPIPFDAIDDKPVDLVVMLLAPENAGSEHLRILAQLSRIARDHHRCAALRGCSSAKALWETLTGTDRQKAA